MSDEPAAHERQALRSALHEDALRKGASESGFIVAPVSSFSMFPRFVTRGGMGIFDHQQRAHRIVARMIVSNADVPVPDFNFAQPIEDFLQRTGAIRVAASGNSVIVNLAEEARASAEQVEAIAEMVERWDPTGEKRENGLLHIVEIGWGEFGPIEEEDAEGAPVPPDSAPDGGSAPR